MILALERSWGSLTCSAGCLLPYTAGRARPARVAIVSGGEPLPQASIRQKARRNGSWPGLASRSHQANARSLCVRVHAIVMPKRRNPAAGGAGLRDPCKRATGNT